MQWDLTQLFKNVKTLESFIKSTEKEAKKFNNEFKNNLNGIKPHDFENIIIKFEKISADISKIMTYAHLNFAKDTSKGAQLAKIEKICNKISENLLFFELEFNSLDNKIQNKFINASKNYKYYLSLLKKQKAHQLTFLEERILLRTSPVSGEAFARLFDETMARIRFEYDGKLLSEEEILSLLHNNNREIRKKAALSLSKTLEQNSHLLTYIYNMIKTDAKITCELRNYDLPETIMHKNNQIEKQSVDALIDASEKSFYLVGKFYEKKRKILKYKKLYDYDRYAPIGKDREISYEESKQIVLEAFKEFSPEFEKLAKRAFDENWIDAFAAKTKQSGAFSHSGSQDTHPFVLLNFNKKRRDVFTMAHELGHALHQYLSYNVSYFNSFTPLTTAETASVFCEMLVFSYMKEKSSDEDKKAMLAGKIEDIFATLYRQINFTTFERRVHAYDGEIQTDEISKIWMEESAKMFDGKLILNDYYKIWWSYIPHFIHTPFYCYSYGYAQLLVLALFGLYKSKKCENFVDIYTKFLSLGGSKEPREMVLMFGFDINKNEFWQIGINEIAKLVDEFTSLK